MKYLGCLIIILLSHLSLAQNETLENQLVVDDKYREDQFYLSLTYNVLRNKPSDLTQNGFSTGVAMGFIRDMPINEKRNVAFGLGLGLAANSYNQNLIIEEISSTYQYSLISESDGNVSKNKFSTYLLELPLEIRWRTSTAQDYNFWRIYTGFKLGYVFFNQSKLKSDLKNLNLNNIKDFNQWQYGITLSAGYSTWNFHFFYRLNNIFDNTAVLDGQSIDLSELKIGLIFYIL